MGDATMRKHMSEDETKAWLISIEFISAEIKPRLAGLPGEIQGAVLADLMSLWLAGHHPDLRQKVFQDWLEVTRKLVEPSEREIFGSAGFPLGGLS